METGDGVEFVGVSKRFDGFLAVDDVSFHVPEGSFFSLLGPSGCGKSTSLRMLSGFDDPDAGDIFIAGERVNGTPPYRRPTNMVFQRWALFPHMSVFDNVAFGPSVQRLGRAEIARQVGAALELVGLGGLADRKPRQLSGGQMQRVALARALVNRPRVLLLDEPLGALDLKLRLQMQIELKRIQESVGTTFVYVTHDQGEALTMSDRIAIMNAGRIEQIGAPHEVYDAPRSRFVATFLGNANVVPVRVLAANGAVAQVEVAGLRFAAVPGEAVSQGTGDMVLRYEAIRLGDAAATMPIRTDAAVRDAVFSGSSIHYRVETDHGLSLTVEVAHNADGRPLPRGHRVEIGWPEGAARLFRAAP